MRRREFGSPPPEAKERIRPAVLAALVFGALSLSSGEARADAPSLETGKDTIEDIEGAAGNTDTLLKLQSTNQRKKVNEWLKTLKAQYFRQKL